MVKPQFDKRLDSRGRHTTLKATTAILALPFDTGNFRFLITGINEVRLRGRCDRLVSLKASSVAQRVEVGPTVLG